MLVNLIRWRYAPQHRHKETDPVMIAKLERWMAAMSRTSLETIEVDWKKEGF